MANESEELQLFESEQENMKDELNEEVYLKRSNDGNNNRKKHCQSRRLDDVDILDLQAVPMDDDCSWLMRLYHKIKITIMMITAVLN